MAGSSPMDRLSRGLIAWQKKITRAVRADPRKASALGVLVVILTVLWARAMGGGSVPGMAGGAVVPRRPGAEAIGAEGPAVPARSAAAARQLLEWVVGPVEPLRRNLFAVNLDFFPRDGSRPGQEIPLGNGFWDRLQKSMRDRAEEEERKRLDLHTAMLEAAQLKLQSTVMGATPTALVNGRLVRVGDSEAGFKVRAIRRRGIVVERYGFVLQVNFKDDSIEGSGR